MEVDCESQRAKRVMGKGGEVALPFLPSFLNLTERGLAAQKSLIEVGESIQLCSAILAMTPAESQRGEVMIPQNTGGDLLVVYK